MFDSNIWSNDSNGKWSLIMQFFTFTLLLARVFIGSNGSMSNSLVVIVLIAEMENKWDALSDLVPFVQFKRRE